ncbi:MAG TPA: tetratricopeptide repeat protein [Terriglobales bacterium]|nr:tetratricopeptide repeat protein [Terriglobales bacterium]
MRISPVLVLIAITTLLNAQDPKETATFNRDVAPIIFQNCSVCHRPGEAGPFPLLNYHDVKSHAKQIVDVTRSHFMPPWLPAPGDFNFADERRLTPGQIATIQKWFEQGAKEGDPRDLPPTPKFTPGWQLGEPDLILKAAKPYILSASGSDQYWNFVMPVPIGKTRWVKAVEIRPADKRLVHHANMLVDRMQSARHMESDPGAGFGGMEISLESEAFDPDSHFLFWKPGSLPYVEPDGLALRLDPGTDLVLNLHLQPSGKPEPIQPSVGLYFTDKPATKFPMLLQIQNDHALDIPPGDSNFVVTSDFTLPVDVDVLAIYPHAHYLGTDLLATATLPDGTRKTLLHIPHWDLKWQGIFRYAEPVTLPKGTVIAMRYVYDNSEDNVANPSVPPKRVTAGNRATDEMAHLWLQVLPKHPMEDNRDARRLLMEALARRSLQNDPADFEAHYNLGSMLQAEGFVHEAIEHYELAVKLRPDHAVANNALGAALVAIGRSADAIAPLQAAISKRPDYFDAHYNLALALHVLGDLNGVINQLTEATRISPNDASAHANLGAVLAEAGRYTEAKAQLEEALRIDPQQEMARENLALLKQQQK